MFVEQDVVVTEALKVRCSDSSLFLKANPGTESFVCESIPMTSAPVTQFSNNCAAAGMFL